MYITKRNERGRSEAGYRAGLSRRRSRVRAPSLPYKPTKFFGRFFFDILIMPMAFKSETGLLSKAKQGVLVYG